MSVTVVDDDIVRPRPCWYSGSARDGHTFEQDAETCRCGVIAALRRVFNDPSRSAIERQRAFNCYDSLRYQERR
jgi:hypothetical protein